MTFAKHLFDCLMSTIDSDAAGRQVYYISESYSCRDCNCSARAHMYLRVIMIMDNNTPEIWFTRTPIMIVVCIIIYSVIMLCGSRQYIVRSTPRAERRTGIADFDSPGLWSNEDRLRCSSRARHAQCHKKWHTLLLQYRFRYIGTILYSYNYIL